MYKREPNSVFHSFSIMTFVGPCSKLKYASSFGGSALWFVIEELLLVVLCFALVTSHSLYTYLHYVLSNIDWENTASCSCSNWKSRNDYSFLEAGSYAGSARSWKLLHMASIVNISVLCLN